MKVLRNVRHRAARAAKKTGYHDVLGSISQIFMESCTLVRIQEVYLTDRQNGNVVDENRLVVLEVSIERFICLLPANFRILCLTRPRFPLLQIVHLKTQSAPSKVFLIMSMTICNMSEWNGEWSSSLSLSLPIF